jgi:hypothetical protein
MNQHEFQFACGVIDDIRRLIAAGKTQRWDIVKWAVTINMALAAASIAVKQRNVNAEEPLFWFAVVTVVIAGFLMWEVTRRMTATRNDSLLLEKYLRENNINLSAITGKSSPERYKLYYDKGELTVYMLILIVSMLPALLVWLL